MFGKMAPELIHQHCQAHTTACGQFDQGRYWERPGVHYSVNGFNTRTPVLRKSAWLRVTTVRSWISAVAASCLSKAFSGSGTLKRPHSCALYRYLIEMFLNRKEPSSTAPHRYQ